LLVDEAPRRSSLPIAPGYESWRATARLLSGRRGRVARLDIEIGISAPGSVLVELRPLDRRPQRWSARRTRRYFALAHAAADRLEQLLNEHASVDVRGGRATHAFGALTIRPIDPDDLEALRALFGRLSPQYRDFRVLSPVNQLGESCLHQLTDVDYHDRDALVASVDDQVVAVARYGRDRTEPRDAEVAVVVDDAWHRHGIATELLRVLSRIAGERGVERFTATVTADNEAVTMLVRSLPVRTTWSWDHGQQTVAVDLGPIGGRSTDGLTRAPDCRLPTSRTRRLGAPARINWKSAEPGGSGVRSRGPKRVPE
jgi:RimJ/RimL family protein N-acetyltransferase